MAKADPALAAAGLRQQLGLGSGAVDVFEVVQNLGIQLHRAPFANALEGAHLVRDGRCFIFVNTANAITRQRLTAAHELGHHVLEDHRVDAARYEENVSDPGNDPVEWAAYTFARHFLMPPDGVMIQTASLKAGDERVAAVASRFTASVDVSAIHLADLQLISPQVKARILREIRSGELRPATFLRSFGYPMAPTPKAEGPELDARYVLKAVDAYEHEWITLDALEGILGLSRDEAAALLADQGVPVREDG